MALLDKITDAAKMAGDKASDAIELTKLKGKVSSEKKAIEIEMAKIGKIYYEKGKAGEELDPEVKEISDKIDAHNEVIDETQASIDALAND